MSNPEDMSAAEKMSRRDEMETLLPFYLNGSLEGSELEAVEEWLATDPAAMAALGEAEAEFSGISAANEAIRPPADALSRPVGDRNTCRAWMWSGGQFVSARKLPLSCRRSTSGLVCSRTNSVTGGSRSSGCDGSVSCPLRCLSNQRRHS